MGGGVGGVPDRIGEDGLHPGHEDLEPLDHGDHLDERELLLAGVVVARSALILFRIRGTLLYARNKLQYVQARELNWLTSVADPGCLSRIPDPDFYPSRIPDPGSKNR